MAKSIFVSCVDNEIHWMKKFEKWNRKGKMGDNVYIMHESEQDFDDYYTIKAYIKEQLIVNNVDMILVLQGNSTHNEDWIRAEVELAAELPALLFCMRVPGTDAPRSEQLSHIKEISFNPNTIVRFLYGKDEKPYRRYRPRPKPTPPPAQTEEEEE